MRYINLRLTYLLTYRKLWHIAGSKWRCWLRERRRNVYNKKPQRHAKDNRTAHLTARSDRSVAYVTNNKRLYSTFCTVDANYWQTRCSARPLCDSRATCFEIIVMLHYVAPRCRCKLLGVCLVGMFVVSTTRNGYRYHHEILGIDERWRYDRASKFYAKLDHYRDHVTEKEKKIFCSKCLGRSLLWL